MPVCERLAAGKDRPVHRDAPTEHGWCRRSSHSEPRLTPDLDSAGAAGDGKEQGRVVAESRRGGAGGDPEGGARHGRPRFEGTRGGLSALAMSGRDGGDRG